MKQKAERWQHKIVIEYKNQIEQNNKRQALTAVNLYTIFLKLLLKF